MLSVHLLLMLKALLQLEVCIFSLLYCLLKLYYPLPLI